MMRLFVVVALVVGVSWFGRQANGRHGKVPDVFRAAEVGKEFTAAPSVGQATMR